MEADVRGKARKVDEQQYEGGYRTKRVIQEICNAMQESICTSQPYETRLDPPLADPRVAHPRKEKKL